MEFQLAPQVKMSVIDSEMTQVEAEMYRLGLRHAIQEKLGNKARCIEIEADMEGVQGAIEYYRAERESVMAEMSKVEVE